MAADAKGVVDSLRCGICGAKNGTVDLCRICGTMLPGAAERRRLATASHLSFSESVEQEVARWQAGTGAAAVRARRAAAPDVDDVPVTGLVIGVGMLLVVLGIGLLLL